MPVPFFGDIGWFYESAKNALLSGYLPLTGITSSVIWLHQGPIWTYFLIPILFIFKYHPLSPVLISTLYYLTSIILSYWTARIYFDKKTGFICAGLFLLSPLLISYAFMPFVTSLVPAFTLLFLLLLKRQKYFTAFLILGFLYQLERISLLIWPVVFIQLYWQKRDFHLSDILAFLLGSTPLIISGPVEFFGPFLFSFYKLLTFFHSSTFNLEFYFNLLNRLLMPYLSAILLISASVYLLIKKNKFAYWLLIPVLGLFLSRSSSEAYFIQLLPYILLSISYFLSRQKLFQIIFIFVLIIFVGDRRLMTEDLNIYRPFLSEKIALVKKVGFYPEKFQVLGNGQEFPSTLSSYRYLFWYFYKNPKPNTSVVINEYSI